MPGSEHIPQNQVKQSACSGQETDVYTIHFEQLSMNSNTINCIIKLIISGFNNIIGMQNISVLFPI